MRRLMFLCIALTFMLSACGNNAGTAAESDTISIGLAYPVEQHSANMYLRQGVDLAVNKINESGGVLGKQLVIREEDDKNDANVGMQKAQTLYEEGITAVIGHWSTNVCYYTEDVYERNKVVMLTPRASGMNIFDDEYSYIFRMCGHNDLYAKTIAEYMSSKHMKRVAIFYTDDEYGVDFAEIMEKELNKYQINVVDRVTSLTPLNVGSIKHRWDAFGCEGIIAAASFPSYIEPIKLLREIGCDLPVFGADNFDYKGVQEMSDGGVEGIYKVFIRPEDMAQEFLDSFLGEYGHMPDLAAVVGYDCVFLLREAIEATGSTDGTKIANYLSRLENYKTVSGTRSYNSETHEFDGFNVEVYSFDKD